MDQGPSRSGFHLDPKLVGILKQISRDTGVSLESLINLSTYELARRLGYLTPDRRSIPPPPGSEILEKAEPQILLERKPPRSKGPPVSVTKPAPPNHRSPASPARVKPGANVLHMQVDDNAPIPIRKNMFLIGRGSRCDYMIEHRSVSREHAVITQERGLWFIEDLNSANGTWVNGEQISKYQINDGDEVLVSNFNLHFSMGPG